MNGQWRWNAGRVLGCALAFVVIGGMGAVRLAGQAATGSILGTVTDQSAAAVPGAAVEVRNTETGAVRSTTSDAAGRFTLPNLAIGTYDVQAAKAGFATVVHRAIALTVGAETVVDFSLPVGQQTQTVAVEAEVTQVETTNSAVGMLTDQKHAIRESLRLQFRAEFFNILNHTNYALPAAALFVGGGSTPGGSLANYTGRNQAAGQIINMVGTPRQIQFALKMIF